jgi:hypothetical protein
MSDHIEEYFVRQGENKEVLTSKELFRADADNVDVKTELDDVEIKIINRMKFNNAYLKSKGLNTIYTDVINNYLRLKISRERKSRVEFVDMNRGQQKTEDILDTMSKVGNITSAKK